MNSKRLNFIDLIEVIAISFVLIYHCTLYVFDFQSDSSFLNYARYFLRTILSTCVPLFFFANGYLLFSRKFDINKHIKKCIRLVVLTVVWSAILVVSMMFIKQDILSVKEIIHKIIFLESGWNNLLWYMGALVIIYIFFPILKSAFDTNKKSFMFFSVICITLTLGLKFINQCMGVLGSFTPLKLDIASVPIIKMFNPFMGFNAYAIAYFCIGGIIYSAQDKIFLIPKVKRNLIAIIVLLLSCCGLFGYGVVYTKYIGAEMFDVVWDGYDSIFTLINVICVYILSLNYNKDYKLIKTISINTLGIYFVHEIIIK